MNLKAPDKAAGKKGKCHVCGEVFEIPSEMPGGRECPGCGNRYPGAAVICVSCGINLDTGEKITSSGIPPDSVRSKRSRLVMEGALAGVLMGVLIFIGILVLEVLLEMLFQGWAGATENFFPRLAGSVIIGVAVGIFLGIATVLTRSAAVGKLISIVLFAGIVAYAWRAGMIGRHLTVFSWMFAAAGLAVLGYFLFIIFGAISKGVIDGIKWEKYE